MTRDWTIIRAVLLRLEAAETANTVLNSHAFEEFVEQHVAYNMRLLAERGYIEANIAESKTGCPRRLNIDPPCRLNIDPGMGVPKRVLSAVDKL